VQGSLASGTFAAYSPVTREAEVCDVQPTAVAEEDEDEMEVEDGEGLAAVAAVEAVLEAQFEA
jgi:hypothetical protein